LLLNLETKNINFLKGGEDLESSYRAIKQGTLTGCWDIYFYMNILINDQYFVWPKYNMVENIDIGGGTHYSDEKPGWTLHWENNTKDILIDKNIKFDAKIYKDFLMFFKSNNTNERNTKIDMKAKIKKALIKLGVEVKKIPRGLNPENIDPADYSTTDGPMEVPCQKESYFYALNNYVKEGDRVLDVGMGVGYGMNLLSIKAKEVHAVDVDKKAVDYCTKANIGKNPKVKKLTLYDGYNLPYKDSYFDVVTNIDVIEHVEDYDRFMDELLRVAKRAVVIATPNRRPEYTNPDGTPTNYWHLREWSYKEFDKIAKSHTKKVEWAFLDGPWEGPFKTTKKVSKDTLVLLPTLKK
jgi:2-polyprenyl-3-methyl-5-hydroxy-6-metoxy-1,4-benzoquinol methylase